MTESSDRAPDAVTEAAAPGSDDEDSAAERDAPAPEPTGVPAADEARDRLAGVRDLPVDEQVAVYEDVHQRLQAGLADLDESRDGGEDPTGR